MNKNIKFLLTFIFVFIATLFVPNVKALSGFSIEDVSIENKSGTIDVVDPVLVSDEITSEIKFNQKDDYVTFKIDIKNNETEAFSFENISDNNTNNNMSITYDYPTGLINPNETTSIKVTFKYAETVKNVDKVDINDLVIRMVLVNEEGETKGDDIIINPTTHDNILKYLMWLIVAFVGVVLSFIFIKNRKVKYSVMVLCLSILIIPTVIYANEEIKFNIKFTNIELVGEYEDYTVSIYDKDENVVGTKTITYGQKVGTLTHDEVPGYTFEKYVDQNGNEVTEDTVITGPTSIIEKYTANTYEVVFDKNNESAEGSMSNQQMTYDTEANFNATTYTYTGYHLTGWNTNPAGTGTSYSVNTPVKNLVTEGTITLYAEWSADTNTKYYVSHQQQQLNGSYVEVEREELTGTTGASITPAVKSYTGFDSPATQTTTINRFGTTEVVYEYDREIVQLNVTDRTYLDNSSSANGDHMYGETITLIAQQRNNYDFKWSDDDTNYTKEFTITSNTTLSLIYTAQTYEIVFDKNSEFAEGTMNAQTLTYDTAASLTINAYTYTGYHFTGWNTNSTGTGTSYADGAEVTNITENTSITLYAQWEANTNTSYVVSHQQQQLDGTYLEVEKEELTGTSDASITPAVKSYTGFDSPATQTTTISRFGTTEVVYEYDRSIVTLNVTDRTYLDNSSSANGDHMYGETITLIAQNRNHYDFKWSDDDTNYTKQFTITDDVTLSLVYTAQTYQVVFDKNSDTATGTMSAQTITYDEETNLTNNAYTNTGYHFVKWNTIIDGTGISYTNGQAVTNITENATITLYAIWAANTDTPYYVSHQQQQLDGTYLEVDKDELYGTSGDTITPVVNSYTGFISPSAQTTTISAAGDTVVTYKYDRVPCELTVTDRTYLTNGSSANGTYMYGETITLTAQNRNHYDFKWSDDDTNYTKEFAITSDTTLSLVYTAQTYQVVFDKNNENAEGTMNAQTLTYDTAANLTTNAYTYTGYHFNGWNTNSAGTGTSYANGVEVTNITENSSITLYAQWEANTNTSYVVSYQQQQLDGTYLEVERDELTGTSDASITPVVKSYTGFVSPTAVTTTISRFGTTEVVYEYDRVPCELTVTDRTYLVSGSSANGTYMYGETITLTAQQRAGLSFKWSDDDTNYTKQFTITEDVTLSLIYIGGTYTITLDSQGGTNYNPILVNAGDQIGTLPTPTKDNSVFVGWFTGITDGVEVTSTYIPEGDMPIYARWKDYVCIKATTLNTQECHSGSGSGCRLAGYSDDDTITYGNLALSDTYNVGDAYLCDVDGSGYNTRFYYMRTLDNNAVLIASDIIVAEGDPHDSNYMWDQAVSLLPTTSQWDNLPVSFEEGTKATRFPTREDTIAALGSSSIGDNNALKDMPFIFENISKYANADGRSTAWVDQVDANTRYRYHINTNNVVLITGTVSTSKNCVKPVIEVPLNYINNSYIVKFDANGGTLTGNEYININKGSALGTLPTVTHTSYQFSGWYKSLQFTTQVDANYVPTGYETYYARWVVNAEDAILVEDQFTLQEGESDTIVITNESELEAYQFVSADDTIATVDSNGVITAVSEGNTTISIEGLSSHTSKTIYVTVHPLANKYTVHFEVDGGSAVEDIEVTKNTAIGPLPDSDKAAYILGGWYTHTNYLTKVTEDTIITSDMTLYAKWIPEDAVAEVNIGTYYNTLGDAITNASSGSTITILKDISSWGGADLKKDLNFDLGGHTITSTGRAFQIYSKVEIGNGTITTNGSSGVIDVVKDSTSTGEFTINSGKLINTRTAQTRKQALYVNGGIAHIGGTAYLQSNADGNATPARSTVQCLGGGTIYITGGTIVNDHNSVYSYAVANSSGTVIIGTKDGQYDNTTPVIRGNAYGLYSNSGAEFSIYDGIIMGKTATINDEIYIDDIETGAVKVNEDIDGYHALYYTLDTPYYIVTLEPQGGTVSPQFLQVDKNQPIGTIPTPSRGVYTFDGWYTGITDGVEVTSDYVVQDNMPIYARWHYNASTEIDDFDTTNSVMQAYYNNLDTWKTNRDTFETNMKANFDAYNCKCADNTCSTSGTVECDKPNGYDTGFNEKVNVYTSDAVNKDKGTLVTYAKGENGIIYNLIPNQVYYWELDSDDNIHGLVRFTGDRRLLNMGDVRNARDLGGLPVDTDGNGTIDGHLKYDKLYRGIGLNSSSSPNELSKFSISEELSLREQSQDTIRYSTYKNAEIQNYIVSPIDDPSDFARTRAGVTTAMQDVIAGKSIYFHCRIGTDRTGTLAYILEGLLGVPEEDRVQDYELSFFYGLVNRHRYYAEEPSSSVSKYRRFVYLHETLMPSNTNIYNWYTYGMTTQEKTDADALIAQFRTAMIDNI